MILLIIQKTAMYGLIALLVFLLWMDAKWNDNRPGRP